MEQRLIDANALPYENQVLSYDDEWCLKVSDIENAPTVDAVEVVRCKDCLHSRELNKYEKQLYLSECVGCTRHSVSYHDAIMMGDDFCSYGERRCDNAVD